MTNVIGPIDFTSWRTMANLVSYIRDHKGDAKFQKVIQRDERLLKEIKEEVLGRKGVG